jgi:hypothetical protein
LPNGDVQRLPGRRSTDEPKPNQIQIERRHEYRKQITGHRYQNTQPKTDRQHKVAGDPYDHKDSIFVRVCPSRADLPMAIPNKKVRDQRREEFNIEGVHRLTVNASVRSCQIAAKSAERLRHRDSRPLNNRIQAALANAARRPSAEDRSRHATARRSQSIGRR